MARKVAEHAVHNPFRTIVSNSSNDVLLPCFVGHGRAAAGFLQSLQLFLDTNHVFLDVLGPVLRSCDGFPVDYRCQFFDGV